jgi:fucose 4-O-acetylase-like acetyltransferase
VATTSTPNANPTVVTKRRDPWFDNIKIILVTLVVVGHSWTLLPEPRLNSWVYDFLYSWHIPAFVLMTGYLSRSFSYTPKRIWALVRTVAVPYFLFSALLAWYRTEVGGEHLERIFLNPHWPMWYLAAMFLWRLMTPIFLRIPFAVLPAAVISLVSGIWATDVLDLSRVLGFLPFFVVGLTMHSRHWALLRSEWARYVGVGVLLAIFVLARYTDHWIKTEWLYYRRPYDQLGSSNAHAMLTRSVLLVIGLCGALAAFAIIPRRHSWLTALGSATLVVYLYHGFFVKAAEYAGYSDWAYRHPTASLPITTVAAIALALVLAVPWIAGPLGLLTDPIGALGRAWRSRPGDRGSHRTAEPGDSEQAASDPNDQPSRSGDPPDRRPTTESGSRDGS